MDNYVIHNYSEESLRPGVNEFDVNEQQVLLAKAMNNLSDEDKLLITLFYHGNNSIEDISVITGLSASNVVDVVKMYKLPVSAFVVALTPKSLPGLVQ